jgi:hypothetical protein
MMSISEGVDDLFSLSTCESQQVSTYCSVWEELGIENRLDLDCGRKSCSRAESSGGVDIDGTGRMCCRRY